MARKKKTTYRDEFKWILDLKEKGYHFMIMPKNRSKSFYASKTPKQKKNGEFHFSSAWDEYRLEKNEQWIPGDDTKNVYIRL